MPNMIERTWNQNHLVNIEDLRGMVFQNEENAHTFQISGIDCDGNAVPLTGTVSGIFIRPDNTDVALTGATSDGIASVTLTPACYGVSGSFGLTVFLTSNGATTAIYAAIGTINQTSTGTVAPETTATVVDLINRIDAAVATIPASYTALMADIAPTYSNDALYTVGQYVWYDGALKRCTHDIATAESYDPAHWTDAVLSNDLHAEIVGVNTALTTALSGKQDTLTFDTAPTENSANPVTSGGVYTANSQLSSAINLMDENLIGTTQTVSFDSDGNPSSVVHSASGSAVRTDGFVWTDNSVTETRTLADGRYITLATNLDTLVTVVSEIQEGE